MEQRRRHFSFQPYWWKKTLFFYSVFSPQTNFAVSPLTLQCLPALFTQNLRRYATEEASVFRQTRCDTSADPICSWFPPQPSKRHLLSYLSSLRSSDSHVPPSCSSKPAPPHSLSARLPSRRARLFSHLFWADLLFLTCLLSLNFMSACRLQHHSDRHRRLPTRDPGCRPFGLVNIVNEVLNCVGVSLPLLHQLTVKSGWFYLANEIIDLWIMMNHFTGSDVTVQLVKSDVIYSRFSCSSSNLISFPVCLILSWSVSDPRIC